MSPTVSYYATSRRLQMSNELIRFHNVKELMSLIGRCKGNKQVANFQIYLQLFLLPYRIFNTSAHKKAGKRLLPGPNIPIISYARMRIEVHDLHLVALRAPSPPEEPVAILAIDNSRQSLYRLRLYHKNTMSCRQSRPQRQRRVLSG